MTLICSQCEDPDISRNIRKKEYIQAQQEFLYMVRSSYSKETHSRKDQTRPQERDWVKDVSILEMRNSEYSQMSATGFLFSFTFLTHFEVKLGLKLLYHVNLKQNISYLMTSYPIVQQPQYLGKFQEGFPVQWLFEGFGSPVTEENSISMLMGGK